MKEELVCVCARHFSLFNIKASAMGGVISKLTLVLRRSVQLAHHQDIRMVGGVRFIARRTEIDEIEVRIHAFWTFLCFCSFSFMIVCFVFFISFSLAR